MKLTEGLKGMESRVAGVQALAQLKADEAADRRRALDSKLRPSCRIVRDEVMEKRIFVAYYHAAKRGLLHLI